VLSIQNQAYKGDWASDPNAAGFLPEVKTPTLPGG